MNRLALRGQKLERFAAILFLDLRGYSAITEQQGSEALGELRSYFYEVCTYQVQSYGGFVIQLNGDEVFASFGAPWSFGKDLPSAARCALAISADLRAGRGKFPPLRIAAGIAAGYVTSSILEEGGRKRPDLYGNAVNLASRLESRAKLLSQDESVILTDETAANGLAGQFELHPQEPFLPQGFKQKTRPWLLTAGRCSEPAETNPPLTGSAAALLEEYSEELYEPIAKGRFSASLLTGDPGSGKSRILGEAASRLKEKGVTVAVIVLSLADRRRILSPFLQLLEGLLSEAQGSGRGQQFAAMISQAPGLAPESAPSLGYLLRIEPYYTQVSQIPGPAIRTQIIQAICDFLCCYAESHPLALLIDDFEFLEETCIEIFSEMMERKPAGLALSGAMADPFSPKISHSRSHRLAVGFLEMLADDAWKRLKVPPLSWDDRLEILSHFCDPDTAHPRLMELLRSDNARTPLYVHTLVRCQHLGRALFDSDIFSRDEAVSLTTLLQNQADFLDEDERRVVRDASLIAGPFDIRVLEIIGSAGETPLRKALERLREAGILTPAEGSQSDEIWEFASPVIRDALRRQLPPDTARRRHGEIARAMESGRLRHAPASYQTASHWLSSDEPEQAARTLREAMAAALAEGHASVVLRIAENGLERVSKRLRETAPDGQHLALKLMIASLHEFSGIAARMLGDLETAKHHFTRWQELGEQSPNPVWANRGRLMLIMTAMENGEIDWCAAACDHLLAEPALPAFIKGQARQLMGNLLIRKRELDKAEQIFTELLRECDTGHRAGMINRAEIENSLGLVCWQKGESEKALVNFHSAFRQFQGAGNLPKMAGASCNQGILFEKLGDFEKAEQHYSKALAIAEKVGFLSLIAQVEVNRGNKALMFRDYQRALALGKRARDFARRSGVPREEGFGLLISALACAGRADFPQAIDHGNKALAIGRALGDQELLLSTILECAWIHAISGGEDHAKRLLSELPREMTGEPDALRQTIEAALASRHAVEERLRLDRLIAWASQVDLPSALRRFDTAILLNSKEQEKILAARENLLTRPVK